MTKAKEAVIIYLVSWFALFSSATADDEGSSGPFSYYDRMLMLNGKLKAENRVEIRHADLNYARVLHNGDKTIFESPKLFKKLREVVLHPNKNSEYLSSLSQNYKSLKVLCVSQNDPLDSKSRACLCCSFAMLDALEIKCPTPNLPELIDSVPSTVGMLVLYQIANLTTQEPTQGKVLNELRCLRFNYSEISKSLFDQFAAPKLQTIYFNQCKIEAGVFGRLSNMASLKGFTSTRDQLLIARG